MPILKISDEISAPAPRSGSRRKMIYIVMIVVLNLAAFIIIYTTFWGGSSVPSHVSITPIAGLGGAGVAVSTTESFQQFLIDLSTDLALLNDPRYQLLRSLGIKIPVASSGRENPFAPF